MFKFTLESNFKTLPELREEIKDLLWKIDHLWWPSHCSKKDLDYLKGTTDKNAIKTNGGYFKTKLTVEDINTWKCIDKVFFNNN